MRQSGTVGNPIRGTSRWKDGGGPARQHPSTRGISLRTSGRAARVPTLLERFERRGQRSRFSSGRFQPASGGQRPEKRSARSPRALQAVPASVHETGLRPMTLLRRRCLCFCSHFFLHIGSAANNCCVGLGYAKVRHQCFHRGRGHFGWHFGEGINLR